MMREPAPSWSYPINLINNLKKISRSSSEVLPAMGGGRSYGDSNFYGREFKEKSASLLMEYESTSGIAKLGAGVTILDALKFLLKHHVTIPILPGTMYATMGGCVASDIHGKNSHKMGVFSDHLVKFELKLGDKIFYVSDPKSDEWKSTVGGQGLSGEIISISIRTIPLGSTKLSSKILPTKSLEDLFEAISRESDNYDFLVGWVDGASKFMRECGFIEVCTEGVNELHHQSPEDKSIWKPNYPHLKLVNILSIFLFNLLTHIKVRIRGNKVQLIDKWDFMFPMARIGNWNYFFGKNGYHEVQFSCDDESLSSAIALLRKICSENRIFLIGVKIMGGTQNGFISFPGQKWSIAINFPASKKSPCRVEAYYNEILKFNGRVNLTKDWVMNSIQFKEMYPRSVELTSWRNKQIVKVVSNFSTRVKI